MGYSPRGCKESDTTEQLKSTSYIYKVPHDYFVCPKLTECFLRILSQLRNMNPMHFAF